MMNQANTRECPKRSARLGGVVEEGKKERGKKVSYPNRSQWLILWIALLLLAWTLIPWVFSLDWWAHTQSMYRMYAWRVFVVLALAAALLFWQASRWRRVRHVVLLAVIATACLAAVVVARLVPKKSDSVPTAAVPESLKPITRDPSKLDAAPPKAVDLSQFSAEPPKR
jgi:phosphoglycerol transferase MdoB-like AlkP superfamily enzyme